jgi:AmmeMemoRadiSam system protein B
MTADWYPQDKKELNKVLDSFLKNKSRSKKKINGIIVPHASYSYSGKIAGRAYSLLKKESIAVILAPSHYIPLSGIISHNEQKWKTMLGAIEIIPNDFEKMDIKKEHAIDNQIPFLQKLGFKKILPIMVGEITLEEANKIAKKISTIKGTFIISSDLSHFLRYEEAIKKDNQTIKAIEKLDQKKLLDIENSACGVFPLLVFIKLAKLKKWKPKLISYTNSGEINGDKSSVVGYSIFNF